MITITITLVSYSVREQRFRNAQQERQKRPRRELARAQAHWEQGDFAEAHAIYQQILAGDRIKWDFPNYNWQRHEAHYGLGVLYQEQGQLAAALPHLLEALRTMQLFNMEWPEPTHFSEVVISRRSRLVDLWLRLGRIYRQQGEIALAKSYLLQAVQSPIRIGEGRFGSDKALSQALHELALSYHGEDNMVAAEAYWLEALGVNTFWWGNSTTSEVLKQLEALYLSQGRNEEGQAMVISRLRSQPAVWLEDKPVTVADSDSYFADLFKRVALLHQQQGRKQAATVAGLDAIKYADRAVAAIEAQIESLAHEIAQTQQNIQQIEQLQEALAPFK